MSYYVLADCNNFYASCERLFNPALDGIPVIVLSNNDGCVVARSQEAKELGIKMGEPYFTIKELCQAMKVAVFSSNYRLYGDLSERVMNILSQEAPEIEIYSIDEAFLKYSASLSSNPLFSECVKLKKKVKQWTGIPISLGIAPTKTLAKVANDLAKKQREVGVFDLTHPQKQKEVLQNYPVGEIWGVGKRLTERLKAMSIYTAWDFREMDPYKIRQKLGVVGERMLWELRGTSCLPLCEPQPKKSIACSRSFGKIVSRQDELAEALATYVSKACVKLRAQKSCASAICVYLESMIDTNTHLRRQYSHTLPFPLATNDTPQMISMAKLILSRLYISGEKYKKCGIILLDLINEKDVIPDLFLGGINPKRKTLMHTVDFINASFGKNTIFFGATGVNPQWKMRSDRCSSYNNTSWDSLPLVKAI